MNREELEETTKQVLELRKQRNALKEQEKVLRDNIIAHFDENKISILKLGDYVIEKKTKFFKTLKKTVSVPESYFELSKAVQLHIKRKQDIELVGNKFVVKK